MFPEEKENHFSLQMFRLERQQQNNNNRETGNEKGQLKSVTSIVISRQTEST